MATQLRPLPHVVIYEGLGSETTSRHAHAVVREHCRIAANVDPANGAISALTDRFAKDKHRRLVQIVQSGTTVLETSRSPGHASHRSRQHRRDAYFRRRKIDN